MITFNVDGARFNLRAAGVAIAEGCVLLHQMAGDTFWTLPGGRPEAMETAAAAVQREMLEETGFHVRVGRALCVVENFFTFQATPYHELLLGFEMTVAPHVAVVAGHRFQGINGEAHLTFWWCPLDALDGLPIRPAFLGELLRAPVADLVHFVHDGRTTS